MIPQALSEGDCTNDVSDILDAGDVCESGQGLTLLEDHDGADGEDVTTESSRSTAR
jgi:hypothetical protein